MKKLTVITIALLLGISGTLPAQFNKAGRTTFQFLKIGVGGRAAAMGEAVIASTQDINSVYWNPAGLTGIENLEAGVNYTKWIADLNVTSGAIGYNFGQAAVAFSYMGLNYGNIQEALTTSTSGGVDSRTGSTFTGSDLALGVTVARRFTDQLSIGVNVKYLRENLFTYTTSLWAADVGTYYDTQWKGIRIAMTAQNFSKQARWLYTGEETQQSYELPLVFRIGASIDLLGGENLFLGGDGSMNKLTLDADAIHTNDYGERLHLGGEYTFMNMLSLRAGYRMNYEEGNLALGAGFKTELSGVKMEFDYAYVKYDFLESPHRFSLIFAF
ncbi:MAG TPA: PorV/PorQ family protein [Ignavibacteriales bacterium]|nr:PorV/PorQ family protein [Ignavibacteriales bacterium]